LEALAAGCIVVASDVPACREVLKDGEYGLLVEPANPSMLASKIEQAFSENLPATSLAKHQAYVSGFSPGAMMEQYINIAENR
jgi:glycosyltransferase involved in cell wall biosynthesis